jgi:hypothetical protein
MQFNAANHIAGPAILTFDSQVWYTEGDITVAIEQAEWTPATSRFGGLGPRIKSLPVGRVSFKPDGQVTTGRMGKAFPYTMSSVGQSIFGASDKTLIIQTLAGQKYTFQKAAVTQSPALVLAADKTAFDGNMSFVCLHKTNTDVAEADSFVKIEANAFSDTSFDETKVITPGFTAAYGDSPFNAMDSLDGFRVEQALATSELSVNRFGVIGAFLTGVGPAVCRFTPAGMTEANWKTLTALDGASIRVPGVAIGSGATDLVISGTGLSVTLNKCGCSASNLAYGAAKERLGELTFKTRAVFSTGAPGALLTISVS